jgi:spore coat polysaccharide biosynthesis predicted glycosyltransferase SpsG
VGIPSAVISQNIDQARETIEFTRKGLAFDLGFGEELKEETLYAAMQTFLLDFNLHHSLIQASRAVFPDDPTLAAARKIAENL